MGASRSYPYRNIFGDTSNTLAVQPHPSGHRSRLMKLYCTDLHNYRYHSEVFFQLASIITIRKARTMMLVIIKSLYDGTFAGSKVRHSKVRVDLSARVYNPPQVNRI